MIRIRLKNEVYTTKHLEGYPHFGTINFFNKDDYYTVRLRDANRVNDLLSQACETGYIDLSREEVVDVITR